MTGLQIFNNIQDFSKRGRKNCAAFCTIRLDVLQGMSVEFFAQKIEDLTCLCFNIEQNLANKLDPTLNRSHLKETAYHTGTHFFYARKSQRPRRFWEIDPDFLQTCSACPSWGSTFGFFGFYFFSPAIFGLRWSTFSEKSQPAKDQAKKQKEKRRVRSSQGHIAETCAKFHGLNRKNGVDIRRGKHLGFLTWTSL